MRPVPTAAVGGGGRRRAARGGGRRPAARGGDRWREARGSVVRMGGVLPCATVVVGFSVCTVIPGTGGDPGAPRFNVLSWEVRIQRR